MYMKIVCFFLFLYLSLVYESDVCCSNIFQKLNMKYKI